MTQLERICNLKKIIAEKLTPLITSDYIFLDLPYYSNIGDTLIWRGTEDYLSSVPHKCLYRCSFATFQYRPLPKDVVILLQGGGNWGDLYPQHNQFRRKIVELYPNNKIIVLPQTVFYEGARNARADAAAFRCHKHLYICARDKYSYRFLHRFSFSRNILLVPDMAFCIKAERLISPVQPTAGRDLFFKRIDKEAVDVTIVEKLLCGKQYDMSDWPLYEGGDPLANKLYSLIVEGKMAEVDKYATKTYLPTRMIVGLEHICKYDRVFSNRLHGAILSFLLGHETYMLDNSYGKNSQFFRTWLKGTDGVHLVAIKRSFNAKRKLRFFYYWFLSLFDRLF